MRDFGRAVVEPPAQSQASRPLTPNEIVTTPPGTTPVVVSSPTNVTVVETDPARAAIPDLTDEQLLDLVADHAAALVRMDGRVRLVIADARRVP